ncbi:phenylalanine--tRNA ligase subunit beta [Piscinibacterium candidicorallinum]|uniref:Phenylalanine--tRNA ligase beta subunit n=1 Tax=Piscinibacterium candidicorallinum TaxID=1793872 RepID=A0ABV7H099_9BURK
MRVPESWLRSMVDPAISTDALAHQLTMSGAEVEEISPVAPAFSGVRVARVLEVSKHPNADKLSVCKVDLGGEAPLQIVCGAPNVRSGMLAPCAVVGAVLPGDFSIKQAKMRGVDSEGMLCSAKELGLSEDGGGLLDLPSDLNVGDDLRSALSLDEKVLTLKLTPNKADCLSIAGIAREVAAINKLRINWPEIRVVAPAISDVLQVRVDAPDLCGRFSGRIVRDVNPNAATPMWMRRRLERAGQRSVSALVDISNYVMLELGRPSHIFDLDRIHGGLTVRWARKGETLKLLNGNTVALDEAVGVIADESAVESLAGIMGGDSTAVGDSTRNIYIEAAFWWPDAIRGRARRFGFSTDAGHRFERGVDASTTVEHIEYITSLVLQICGGQAGPVTDVVLGLPHRPAVRMRVARCQQVIGASIDASEMGDIFRRLGLDATREQDSFVVTPPPYRFDLEIEEDLIEEVARIWGYDNLPARAPLARATMRSHSQTRRTPHTIRAALSRLGYVEAVNYSFVDAGWERDFGTAGEPIKVLNPIASDMAVMRTSLIGGLVANFTHNARHRESDVRMFEVGKVFIRDAAASDGPLSVQGIRQPMHFAAIASGLAQPEQWGSKPSRAVDFFDVKGDLEALVPRITLGFEAAEHPALHPGRCARVLHEGRTVGFIGELHPRWVQQYDLPSAPILMECELEPWLVAQVPVFEDFPRTPAVTRDLAIVVTEATPMARIGAVLEQVARSPEISGVVRRWQLFDVYSGKGLQDGQKSLALRLWLQDTGSTLDEQKIEQIQQVVLRALGSVGAELRR